MPFEIHYAKPVSTYHLHLNFQRKPVARKIGKIVLLIKRILNKTFYVCAAHFGSKTWSIPGMIYRLPGAIFKRIHGHHSRQTFSEELFGTPSYHYRPQRQLSSNEAATIVKYAAAATVCHACDDRFVKSEYTLLKPQKLSITEKDISITPRENCYFDEESGLKIVLMEKCDEIVFGFGALRSCSSEVKDAKGIKKLNNKIYAAAINNIIGTVPKIYFKALEIFKVLKQAPYLSGKKITLTGQCFGGSIASFIALSEKQQAYCFNSVPLGVGLQKALGNNKLSEAKKYITHISVKNDYITDFPGMYIFNFLLNFVGIRTAGNFGNAYVIPSAFKLLDHFRTHSFVMASFMNYIMQDSWATLEALKERGKNSPNSIEI